MSDAQFVLRVGPGLYIDSNGELRSGPDPGLPTYEPPGGGVLFKPETIREVFKDISKALPDRDNPKSRQKLERLGVPDEVIDLLQVVGTVASVASIVFAVVAAVFAVLRILGVFKTGPSEAEKLVERRYQDLDRRLQGMQVIWRQQVVAYARNDLRDALIKADEFVEMVTKSRPTSAELKNAVTELLDFLDNKGLAAVRKLLDLSTWLSGFDQEHYDRVWPWIWYGLYRLPPGTNPDNPPSSAYARFYEDGEVVFDHRGMVPGAIFAVETYLTIIGAATPEYRSTGEFEMFLRSFSDDLELLAETMLKESLARTIAHPSEYSWLYESEVVHTLFGPPQVGPGCRRFAVGAMDLRNQTNDYWDTLRRKAYEAGDTDPNRLGSMFLRWKPPAKLVPEPSPIAGLSGVVYRITNPEECAAAANAQAEKDYLEVVYASGYLNMAHLVATLRHLATEPDRSQTVATESLTRHDEVSTQIDVLLKSSPSPFEPEITAKGDRRMQRGRFVAYATTQVPERKVKLKYRVVLRTLPSQGAGWSEPKYAGEHHRAYYIPKTFTRRDGAEWAGNALQVDVRQSLDEKELISGTSLVELRATGRQTVTLKADTFDWWVPYKSADPLETADRIQWIDVMRQQAAGLPGGSPGGGSTGWSAGIETSARVSPPPMQTLSHDLIAPLIAEKPDLSYIDLATAYQDPRKLGGLHREISQQDVEIAYELDWKGDSLRIKLQSRPQDRCYTVFLVIEEQLFGSQQWLHTAVPFHADGYVTFVPQEFFEQERETRMRAVKTIGQFAQKYRESRPPLVIGPEPDPVIGWIRPDDLLHGESLARIVQVAEQYAPELLREAVTEAERERAKAT